MVPNSRMAFLAELPSEKATTGCSITIWLARSNGWWGAESYRLHLPDGFFLLFAGSAAFLKPFELRPS